MASTTTRNCSYTLFDSQNLIFIVPGPGEGCLRKRPHNCSSRPSPRLKFCMRRATTLAIVFYKTRGLEGGGFGGCKGSSLDGEHKRFSRGGAPPCTVAIKCNTARTHDCWPSTTTNNCRMGDAESQNLIFRVPGPEEKLQST